VYHGRAVATNSVGTSYTADVSFQVSGDRFNVVAPGNPVVATSTNFPSGNSAANAVDGRGFSKYENFDVLNTGFTVWASNTDSPVRALSLISANGPLDNDPDSYALYGSHDGSNFISIASGSVPLFVERSAIQSFSFANTTAYAAYKVIFPTVVSPDFVNSMQIAEVELLPYPEIIAGNGALTLSLPSGAALSALNGPASALLDRQLRFNANKIVVLDCTNSVTALITPTTGATIVKGIAIIGGNDSGVFPERTPSSVTLEGSNDGTNFFPLATFTPDLPVSGMQIQSRAIFANTSSYTQYRVTFGVPNSGSTLQIGELRLFGEPPVAAPALALHASGNNVIVRWPPALGFQLETKAALSQPAWIAVTNVPVFSDGMNTVTIPMDATTGFFRLKK
jgi:hypothetical protein